MSRGTTRFMQAAVAAGVGALMAAALPSSAAADLGSARAQIWQQGNGGLDDSAEAHLRVPTAGYAGVYRTRGDAFGQAVATGDFNSDGLDDLAVGAPDEDAPLSNVEEDAEYSSVTPGNGAVTIIYGSMRQRGLAQAYPDQYFTPANDGVSETGNANPGSQQFGYALAAGDFNHDGKDDLAIGVPGNGGGGVVVLYGQNPGDPRVGLGTAGAQYVSQDSPGIEGASEGGDRFGAALAVGDFDQGVADDLAVGVPFEDDQAGAVNVIYGGSGGLVAANGNQMWHQNTPGIHGGAEGSDDNCSPVICQDMEGDRFGHSLAAATSTATASTTSRSASPTS